MRFAASNLQTALADWRALKDVKERASADNIWFEQKVSPDRQQAFEGEAIGAVDPASLKNAHTDYWSDFVRTDGVVPHTFDEAIVPASLGMIDEAQLIVRIESLVRPLDKHGIKFDALQSAFENTDKAVIQGFLSTWNGSNVRDWRPTFAAFKDEVISELAKPEWPSRLRDRLGLAHYDCRDGPIPIALMEYTVAEVIEAAAAKGVKSAFTAPTVLDSGPWPYFFPAPLEIRSDNGALQGPG